MATPSWLSDLADDVRFGFRTLRKTPGFTAIAVITLALGIGANTAIFSVIETVLLRPLPYTDPESLVEIRNTYPSFPPVSIAAGDFSDFQREAKSFSAMGAYAEISQGFNLTGVGEPERIDSSVATSDLFSMLGVRAVVGRTFLSEEDKPGGGSVALVTYHYWHERFSADPSIIGREIALDNRKFRIVGVLPDSFQIMKTMDFWLPYPFYEGVLNDHIHHGIVPVARLRPGVTVAQASAEIDTLHRQEATAYPDSHKNWGTLVRPMEDPAAAKFRATLLVLFAAVGLVLLIACANIANLLLARNAAREREMALRTALGAAPGRLARQLLTESVLLALFGGGAGLLLALLGIEALAAIAPAGLSIVSETRINLQVLAFTLGICLASGILCGLLPALRARVRDLNNVLKRGSKGSGTAGSHRVHNLLVVAEIALALVPLIGAGLLLQSFRRLLEVAPGFQTEHVLSMQITQAALPIADQLKLTQEQSLVLGKKQSLLFDQVVQKIDALPGVKSAAGISTLPLANDMREASRFLIEGQPQMSAGVRPVAQVRTATPEYFDTVGIPLQRGRFLTRDDWATGDKIVINDTMAHRFFEGQDPIGDRVNFCSLDPQPCWYSIVGIVGNVHQFGLEHEPTYDAYFTGGWTPRLVIRTTSDPSTISAAVTEAVHSVDPTLPVTEITTLDGLLSRSVSPRRFSAVLIGILAGLALVLSAVGIYGVMSYTVGQRTQEIGVRMAMGAQPRNMLALILGRGAWLALVGIAAGTLGALALTRFLSSLLFGIAPKDPLTFFGVALLLFGVALAACYVPARRAMRVDPMVALRYE
ncbi:MAG: ABC transporter permease [Acidobacteria bacterium]|nr:ABC transporter permease [Acidobacteriota bacterium]